jgi:uncharacterized protein (DUF362 family)
MDHRDPRRPGIDRRDWLKLVSGALAAAVPHGALHAQTAPYRVGVGSDSNPYAATVAAVSESGEWPAASIAGRTVVIKVNLVLSQPAELGGTTHPEVARALVDLSLAAGAAHVRIIESARLGVGFVNCRYEFFDTYDTEGRVSLLDLSLAKATFTRVPNGSAYGSLFLPNVVLDPNIVFISAAKLKTHVETGATLSLKNLFGLPPVAPYYDPEEAEFRSRFRLHDRSVNQAITDIVLTRPIDFAVIDASVGMEGGSPDQGTPVRMDRVIAGRNAVAVDRVGLAMMQAPQSTAAHLAYAAGSGIGPSTFSQIEVRGAFTSRAFRQPLIPPTAWIPKAYPVVFAPRLGRQTTIAYSLGEPTEARVQIVRVTDQRPTITTIRTLQDWTMQSAGVNGVRWDGRDDSGQLVSPATYAIRVQTRRDAESMFGAATGWVIATA